MDREEQAFERRAVDARVDGNVLLGNWDRGGRVQGVGLHDVRGLHNDMGLGVHVFRAGVVGKH